MIPEGNNVYGHFTAPNGLEQVLRAVEQVVEAIGNGGAYIYRSQFDGAQTLHLSSESANFDSDILENGVQHLFNGGVGGSLEEVVSFVRVLSEALSRSGIEHSFEIYDDRKLHQLISG